MEKCQKLEESQVHSATFAGLRRWNLTDQALYFQHILARKGSVYVFGIGSASRFITNPKLVGFSRSNLLPPTPLLTVNQVEGNRGTTKVLPSLVEYKILF